MAVARKETGDGRSVLPPIMQSAGNPSAARMGERDGVGGSGRLSHICDMRPVICARLETSRGKALVTRCFPIRRCAAYLLQRRPLSRPKLAECGDWSPSAVLGCVIAGLRPARICLAAVARYSARRAMLVCLLRAFCP